MCPALRQPGLPEDGEQEDGVLGADPALLPGRCGLVRHHLDGTHLGVAVEGAPRGGLGPRVLVLPGAAALHASRVYTRAANDLSVFTIMEKSPTRGLVGAFKQEKAFFVIVETDGSTE